MTQRYSRRRLWLIVVASLFVANLGGLYYIGKFTDNFRVVSPGRMYRSAQMSDHTLRKTITTYGIKTIINLRGASLEAWYTIEVKIARELGVNLVDIELDPTRLPPPDKLQMLLRVFSEGPYPILVHCQAGADRTGLASVIYKVVFEHEELSAALNAHLTWRQGHLPIGKTQAMDEFFALYRKTGRGKDLATWIREIYPVLYAMQDAMR